MSKLVKYIISIAVAAIVIFLVWYFSRIVAYVLVSAVLAIIGKPLVTLLTTKVYIRKQHFPKWLAAFIALLVIWGVAALFVSLFVPLIFNKINEFSQLDMQHIVRSFKVPLESLQRTIENLFGGHVAEFSIEDALVGQITSLLDISLINNILSSIVSTLGNTAIALFSITFITFFFLKEDHLFFDMVVALFPKKYESNITHAFTSISELLIRYFTGIMTESMTLILVISIVLMIFGMPVGNAFLIGLIMGILNVIPYIGPLIGSGISLLIGILSPIAGVSTLGMVLIIGGTILVMKGIDDFVLQPMLYSNRVKAHPLEIFLVILIAGSVAGVLGMLLAIPAYNVIRVFAKEFFNHFSIVQKLTEKI